MAALNLDFWNGISCKSDEFFLEAETAVSSSLPPGGAGRGGRGEKTADISDYYWKTRKGPLNRNDNVPAHLKHVFPGCEKRVGERPNSA